MKTFELMRPKDWYDNVLKQREKDGKSFFERYKHEFVSVICPVCQNEGKNIFEKYGFVHCFCEKCRTIFCSPRPTDKLLSVYYNDYEAPKMWTNLLLKTDAARKSLQYNPRVEKIISVLQKDSKIQNGIALDLGAGSGAFSLCLNNTGFFSDVIALDLSEACVRACRKQGLNSSVGTIEDIGTGSIDLICVNDLIEHVFDPYSFLQDCFRVLREGGYISIATPNGEGFDFKILKNKTKNITPPEHLTYFNPYSMNLILNKVGFQTILVETPGKLDVEIMLEEKKAGYPLSQKNEYLDYLLEQDEKVLTDFQNFLSENKLSSHMLIVARKDRVEGQST
jgi:2-polyprenyl-3-methyl-5-hydroxy-6-metoxy-1,4-benzoquinol methylase